MPPKELSLGEKQRLFSRLLPRLLDHMHGEGYEVALAEGYVGQSIDKPSEDSPHLRQGGHFKKIAQDVDLFKDGVYQFKTEHHRVFGEFWEGLHPLCRWGGRWGDGNHYSLEDHGVA